MKYLKINTIIIATVTETKTNSKNCVSEVTLTVEPKKNIETKTRMGCRSEEKRKPRIPAKEVTERTSSLSISAPLKPKKKNRIQKVGAPRKPLINPPRSSTPNHIREEKKERAKQRLKLKIWSLLIDVRLTIKSERSVKRKKVTPKPNPATKLSTDKPKARNEIIPLWIDKSPT
jgi:hypothetical protein